MNIAHPHAEPDIQRHVSSPRWSRYSGTNFILTLIQIFRNKAHSKADPDIQKHISFSRWSRHSGIYFILTLISDIQELISYSHWFQTFRNIFHTHADSRHSGTYFILTLILDIREHISHSRWLRHLVFLFPIICSFLKIFYPTLGCIKYYNLHPPTPLSHPSRAPCTFCNEKNRFPPLFLLFFSGGPPPLKKFIIVRRESRRLKAL